MAIYKHEPPQMAYLCDFWHKKIVGKFVLKLTDDYGSSSWARTSDIMINSHALCQLSYRGILIPAASYSPGQSPAKYHRR